MSPCNYSETTTTLSGSSPTSGTLAAGTDSGQFSSTAVQPFYAPSTLAITSAVSGVQWQGAISLSAAGAQLLAMQTGAPTGSTPAPSILVGVVPSQGGSAASLSGPFQFFGMATNLTSGVAGDEGLLQAVLFDGHQGLTGQESANTWNPTTRTGGIQQTTANLTGSYTVDSSGNVTVTFTSGVLNGYTLTGATSGALIVLTNTAMTGPRILLVGIAQPTTVSQQCTTSPLVGPALADGVFQTVALTFNSSLISQLTFHNVSGPTYTFDQNGGTINNGGVLTSWPAAGPYNYTIDPSCFITVPRQTDGSGVVLDASWATTDPTGSVVAFEDFDTSGGGPVITVGVRISNVLMLQ